MRLSKHRRKTRAEMDMTPMIDVAFQLIIFFMTVSQMSQVNTERLQLPKQPGSEDQKPKTLVVNISEQGELRVSGERLTVAGLVSLLSDELQRAGNDPTKLVVVVRADERGESRTVNEVVIALGKLGLLRVRIAVESEG